MKRKTRTFLGNGFTVPLFFLGLLIMTPKTSGDLTTHFSEWEFRSPDNGECWVQKPFVERLEVARKIAGVPFVITSGCRTPSHNESVGGKENSAHLRGWAADIHVPDSQDRGKILEALYRVGFKRIGIGSNFIHVDSDPSLPTPRTWVY